MENNILLSRRYLVFVVILLVIIGASTAINNSLKGWSESEKVMLYNSFYKETAKITLNQAQRKALTTCFTEKIISQYPNTLSGLPKDSIDKVSEQIAVECAENITDIAWSPITEKIVLKKISSLEMLQKIPLSKRMAYANCVLSQLKEKYPKGITGPIAQADMNKVYSICLQVLK